MIETVLEIWKRSMPRMLRLDLSYPANRRTPSSPHWLGRDQPDRVSMVHPMNVFKMFISAVELSIAYHVGRCQSSRFIWTLGDLQLQMIPHARGQGLICYLTRTYCTFSNHPYSDKTRRVLPSDYSHRWSARGLYTTMAPDLNSLHANGRWDYSTPGSGGYNVPNIVYNVSIFISDFRYDSLLP